MKKIKRIAMSILPVASLSVATMVMTSCSDINMYKKLAKEMQEDVINEFTWLCNTPHRTFQTKELCDKLVQRIIQYGISEDKIDDDSTTYRPGLWQELNIPEKDQEKVGYDICYDIESNTPGMPGIILQAHTDMVWVTEDPGETLTHPIPARGSDPITGKEIIYSDGHKTSLGADDGIGVATILALTKHRNDFKHGKIRVILTTDEEDGPSGALAPYGVKNEWVADTNNIPYFLNIDLENALNICVSSGGSLMCEWTYTTDKIQVKTDEYDFLNHAFSIKITNLRGGHSAKYINDNRVNAIKILCEFLGNEVATINGTRGNPENVYIFGMAESTGIGNEPSSNVIPSGGGVVFVPQNIVTADITEMSRKIIALSNACAALQERIREEYNEPKATVTLEATTPGEGNTFITPAGTQDIINIVKNLPYGANEFMEDGTPVTSYNISSIRINDNLKATNPGKIFIQCMGRSIDSTVIGSSDSDENATMKEKYKSIFGNLGETNFMSWTPPWFPSMANPLPDRIKLGANKMKYKIVNFNEHSWLELGAFSYKSNNKLFLAALGPTVHEAHSINECVEIDTIIPMLRIILYTLEHLPIVNNNQTNIRKENTNE